MKANTIRALYRFALLVIFFTCLLSEKFFSLNLFAETGAVLAAIAAWRASNKITGFYFEGREFKAISDAADKKIIKLDVRMAIFGVLINGFSSDLGKIFEFIAHKIRI